MLSAYSSNVRSHSISRSGPTESTHDSWLGSSFIPYWTLPTNAYPPSEVAASERNEEYVGLPSPLACR